MTQSSTESVKVGMSDSPKWVKRGNRIYKIDKIGYHHILREGKKLFHVFHVTSGLTYMKIVLNTENLIWKLEEINDGV